MKGPKKPSEYLSEFSRALDENVENWTVYNSHDPSIFADNGVYYILSTDTKTSSSNSELNAGGQIRKSTNLLDWEWVGRAFEGVPQTAYEWTEAKGLWAPEVAKWDDKYFLYYCASQFGTNQSFIGVATSTSMEGPWIDQGEVYKTSKTDRPNAIDPNIVFDRNQHPYLIYGSFFGGIYAAKLDRSTGKLLEPGEGVCIARRENETKEGAVEGPYMIYRHEEDMYYLFVSYDSLFSNYNVRVGRSSEITGPFLDYNGLDLADITSRPSDEIGTKILAGYKFQDGGGWMAPGHNSILEEDGDYFICHHARMLEKKDIFCLHIRRIVWTEDGWPLVSPERYTGEVLERIDSTAIIGSWDAVKFERLVEGVHESFDLQFLADHQLKMNNEIYNWIKTDIYTCKLFHEDDNINEVAELKILKAWDWERDCETLVFTGMDANGTCMFGKKIE
ncbi:arabinan endo-1,5-alpha-L-arabinosidase [Halalkalibacter akibai]|uniref:Glycoside hydrolase n=1 Tax=Halalkalibacter akibai (strain ATCC 43226 / DSM 21942 / CIP 109018 / JCM 9157 / 1139) TaxID=1236973 RepID=W4QPD1_HALA3|nr:arabinan endo-1,5-alpha-L-arabinosidase [Halalkalibacter akibai]GAE33950.1 glycoside hydrolase [Halalkalibacter akibai JCM 9157]